MQRGEWKNKMRGYLSVFTKTILIIIIIAILFITYSQVVEFKYEVYEDYYKYMKLSEGEKPSEIKKIKEFVEFSCLTNKSVIFLVNPINKEISIEGKEVCEEQECLNLSKEFGYLNIKEKGLVIVECEESKLLFRKT